jgi:inositol phosphorylceramide mannosyltransferase catalytic subunit
MSPRQRMTEGIAAARALVASGDLAGAEALLETLTTDPAIRALGPQTTLGLPRRLHSVLLHLAKAQRDPLRRAGYQFHLVPRPEILAPLFRYSATEQHAINAANAKPVPRTIHQIWIGALPVPAACAAWQAHADATGYTYRLWCEADLDALGLPANPVFADMLERRDYPGAVDVARYAILAAHGGIYLDCDWYPARDDLAFHDLLPLIGLTAMAEDTPRQTGQGGLLLANSFIATPPDHPALHRLNASLAAALAALPDAPAWWSTGPLVFTLAARGGAVSIAPHTLVAGTLPRSAPFADVQAIQRASAATDNGLLIVWKPW